MFRDVAFGQYYPAKSFVHRMDPRVKILLNLLYMITIFLVQSYFGYALMLAYPVSYTHLTLPTILLV